MNYKMCIISTNQTEYIFFVLINSIQVLFEQKDRFENLGWQVVKFMFSKKATKIDEIFAIYLTLCSKCQIHGEDFVNFCGLLRKREL